MIKIKLIVNADDFGYSKGVNLGIIEGYKNGVIRSTTLMTNMPGVDDAVELANKNPGLGVGIHLVLSCGQPIRNDVPSLVSNDGKFHNINDVPKLAKEEDIRKEFESQIERFLSYGIKPTHIDSHHHVHNNQLVMNIVLELAYKYNLPVRIFHKEQELKGKYSNIKAVDYFTGKFYGDGLNENKFLQEITVGENVKTMELMCHPAYLDKEILKGSSYNIQRTNELAILTSKTVMEEVNKRGIELVNYRAI